MSKLIVFDIAGTTLQDDNVVNKAFVSAFNEFDIHPTKVQIDKVMGLAKPLAIDLVCQENKIDVYDVNSIHKVFLNKMISHYSNIDNVKEIEGVSEAFVKLKAKNYLLALDTGFSSDITNLIIKSTGWVERGLIDAYISSDQVSHGRPYPYMIFRLMERLSIQRTRDVIKVGDTLSDIQEGILASCGLVVGVLSGTGTQEEFSKCLSNLHIMPDVTHLPNFL